MCEGLFQAGSFVTLFAHTNSPTKISSQKVDDIYGIQNVKIKLNLFYSNYKKGIEFFIAIISVINFLFSIFKNNIPKYIISRNLYAAFFFSFLFRKSIIYETHSPENGFRKKIQKWLLSSDKVNTVVISNALKTIIIELYKIDGKRVHVFHDAARAGRKRLEFSERRNLGQKLLSNTFSLNHYKKTIGYFGHLYTGRGIEIIEGLARLNPEYAFCVYGGNEKEILEYKKKNTNNNLYYMGFINPKKVHATMQTMDILLMPYQNFVSIGINNSDTSKWMSPMKLFEYLSVGVPLISSDINVLKEVLIDNENCILVEPDNLDAWNKAIQKLEIDPKFAEYIGYNAFKLYENKYTWKYRAQKILSINYD